MKRRNWIALILVLGLLTVAGFLTVVQRGAAATELSGLTYATDVRQRICKEIWEEIGLWYSYFDDKGIHWESELHRCLHRAIEARSDYEFFASISAMVRRLEDSHSYVYEYPRPVSRDRGRPRIHIAEVEGKPIRLEVSGFKFQVSRWREYRTDGSLIEGRGVPADISVSPTVSDIAGCIDSALICAVDYLRSP